MARYRCPGCGHLYDEALGNPHEGFPPGTRWAQIPDDWACPDCAVRDKADFLRDDQPDVR
jgi:rubredoxin